MRLGCNLMLWTGCFTRKNVKTIDRVARLGFDGVELPLFDPSAVDIPATRRALEGHGLGATVCSVITAGSFLSASAADRQKALDGQVRVLEVAGEIGATCVAGPIYSPVGLLVGRGRTVAEWKRAVTCLRKLGKVAEEIGIDVGVEPLNRFETYFLNTCADATRLCQEVNSPRVGILYDTFHANIEEKDPVAALKKITPKWLKHVHTCENDRGIPGSGHVPWDATMQALRDMKYDRWLTIESFVPAIKELARAASIWRPLARDGDDLARQGIRFLRRYVA